MHERRQHARRLSDRVTNHVDRQAVAVVPIDDPRWIWIARAMEAFEASIAFMAVIQAITFFFDPDSLTRNTAIAQAVPMWLVHVWSAAYGLGGLLCGGGLYVGRRRFGLTKWEMTGLNLELAGLAMLCFGALANLCAFLFEVGVSTGTFTLGAIAAACVLRAWALVQINRLHVVMAQQPGEAE